MLCFSSLLAADGDSSLLSSAMKKKRFRKKLSKRKRLRLQIQERMTMKKSSVSSGETAAESKKLKGKKK